MKNIVMVGGSSGIGLAVIQNLHNESIINISRTPCAVAGVKNIQADISDVKSIEKAFSEVKKIDALIYCAGTSLATPVEYAEDDDLKYVFDVNILGAIRCCKAAMRKLQSADDGRIIIIGSAGGIAPIAYDSLYCASKAGVISLCAALRLETNVKSTAVIVGGTQTQFSFKRKVYDNYGAHSECVKHATDALTKIEQTGYSAECIAKKVVKTLRAKNPPPKVTAGIKNKLALWLYKALPWQLQIAALKTTYNLSATTE